MSLHMNFRAMRVEEVANKRMRKKEEFIFQTVTEKIQIISLFASFKLILCYFSDNASNTHFLYKILTIFLMFLSEKEIL